MQRVALCAVVVQTNERSRPTPRHPESHTRPSGPIEFADVTAQAGIRFKHNSGAFGKIFAETIGAGCAFLDYDNDGWQDHPARQLDGLARSQKRKSFLALYHNNKDGTLQRDRAGWPRNRNVWHRVAVADTIMMATTISTSPVWS